MSDLNLVFDIGANNGDDAAAYLDHHCKVVAVEANPDLCAEMRERFSAEIASGQLVLVDRAISRRRKVKLYINSSDHQWGTILPSYAEQGRKLRGEINTVEVETTTVIDLIREHGVPQRMKIDIEGVDYLCLLDLFDSDLPTHLSIERPRALIDQMFVLGLLRRLGYRRFAFVDQGDELHGTSGLFIDDVPARAWRGPTAAKATTVALYGLRAAFGIMRRTPGLRAHAPRARWFDIHAERTSLSTVSIH